MLNSTPLFVIIILILLILLLFWWGLTRNRNQAQSTTTTHEDHPVHRDHPAHDPITHTSATSDHAISDHAVSVYEDATSDHADLDLDPADLNIGRVPEVEATQTTMPSTTSDLDPAVASLAGSAPEAEAEINQPINFDAVDLDATGTIPAGEQIQQHLPPTRFDEIDLGLDPNAPRVLEDQGELIPDESIPDQSPSTVSTPDDLKIIEGIGPRIAALLTQHGITTFAQLAATDITHIQHILDQANLHLADPQTWPQQAQLAADGRLDDLRTLQDQLKGGRNA